MDWRKEPLNVIPTAARGRRCRGPVHQNEDVFLEIDQQRN